MRDGIERLQAIPGVERAAATCCVPLEGGTACRSASSAAHSRRARSMVAAHGSPSRPATSTCSRSRSRAGARSPIATTALAPAVVIINEAMAKQYWKDGDPLNDRIADRRGSDEGAR